MVTCSSPGVTVTSVGRPGTVRGVTAGEGAEPGPVPASFVAATVNVYDWPFVSPPIGIGLPRPCAVWPPDEVTV